MGAYILLADDEPDLVWAVRHYLTGEGYEVATASDGVEALALARQRRPDLVILDIVMPQLDGLKVCHELRSDPGLAATPILFLTAKGAVEDRLKGLDCGGDDYLPKPFDVRELRSRVKALLRRRSSVFVKLDPRGPRRGRYDARWKVIDNLPAEG